MGRAFPNLEQSAFSRQKKLKAYALSNRRGSLFPANLQHSRKLSIQNLGLVVNPGNENSIEALANQWDSIVEDINKDLDRIRAKELSRKDRFQSLAGNLKGYNLLTGT